MTKVTILYVNLLTIATVLGLYGYSLAYYLSDHLPKISPFFFFIIFALTSLLLYVPLSITTFLEVRRKKTAFIFFHSYRNDCYPCFTCFHAVFFDYDDVMEE